MSAALLAVPASKRAPNEEAAKPVDGWRLPSVLEPRSRAGRLLSLVTPMHNEAEGLPLFFDRCTAVLDALRVRWELVCVDDGSRDETLPLLMTRARVDPRVRVVALARNFGKEAALTAGLDEARGDMVVAIDADLQDPPELIAEFVARWEAGYDVVYGVRASRAEDGLAKRATAAMFYKVFNRLSDVPIPTATGDFRLMDRSVVEALKSLPERNRFMKGLFAWVGFQQTGVAYVRPGRAAGTSSWRYWALWNFALDGITSFSSLPLRVWSLLGVLMAAASMATAAALVVRTLMFGRDVPGYASLMVAVLFSLSLQMMAFGVLGEYIGRLYRESKDRPIYIVRRRYGFPAASSETDGEG